LGCQPPNLTLLSTPHIGRCYLAAGRRGLGENSSVAHSAMLLLSLAAWEGHPQQAERRRLMAQLAEGIVQQQRKDGSLQARLGVCRSGRLAERAGWARCGGDVMARFAAGGVLASRQLHRASRKVAPPSPASMIHSLLQHLTPFT